MKSQNKRRRRRLKNAVYRKELREDEALTQYSSDEKLLVSLHQVAKNPMTKDQGTMVHSLITWYLRHQSWTFKQREFAKSLVGE